MWGKLRRHLRDLNSFTLGVAAGRDFSKGSLLGGKRVPMNGPEGLKRGERVRKCGGWVLTI